MTHGLQEVAAAQGSFKVAFPDAAEKMKTVITQLKEAQACIPPCEGGCESRSKPIGILEGREEEEAAKDCRFGGFKMLPGQWTPGSCMDLKRAKGPWAGGAETQRSHSTGLQEFARRFFCKGCYSRVCDLPLDCPVQDVTVTRGDQAMFSCIVNFKLPKEEITYSWKFAGGGLRTRDLSYFRDVPRAEGYLARIRPAQLTHRGTFSCEIKQDQRPLARLYFFLNVTGPPPRAETELQAAFREVLRWAPRDAELIEPWRPSLGELLARPEALTPSNLFLLAALGALASVCATGLVWMFFEWYRSGS
ncbi:sperm acrosome membrane-associated protein 6 isoform X2 [Saimiri boliviensis]